MSILYFETAGGHTNCNCCGDTIMKGIEYTNNRDNVVDLCMHCAKSIGQEAGANLYNSYHDLEIPDDDTHY